MSKSRSTLLIALVLAGTLGVAAGSSHADMVKLGVSPIDPYGSGELRPGATRNAGEPDTPQQTAPHSNMTRGDRSDGLSAPAAHMNDEALMQWFRVTWVIWVARYLNLNP